MNVILLQTPPQRSNLFPALWLALVLVVLLAGCKAQQEDSASENPFEGQPWYAIEQTDQLDASGSHKVACQRPEFGPTELIEAALRDGVSFLVERDEARDDGQIDLVRITLEFDDGPVEIVYYNGKEHCDFQAKMRGLEVFNTDGASTGNLDRM
jgi:hypothetical protein